MQFCGICERISLDCFSYINLCSQSLKALDDHALIQPAIMTSKTWARGRVIYPCLTKLQPLSARPEFSILLFDLPFPSPPLQKINLFCSMPILRKRHSWPPSRKPKVFYADEEIDQDPFRFFVSPAEDHDQFIENDLAADIETRKSRSLPPTLRKTRTFTLAVASSSPSTTRLKRWIERMELHCFRRSPSVIQRPMPSPDPPKPPEMSTPSSPPVRGRRTYRAGSGRRSGHNSRSKARRPRAWRAPSQDIWPVVEEGEDVGLGIMV